MPAIFHLLPLAEVEITSSDVSSSSSSSSSHSSSYSSTASSSSSSPTPSSSSRHQNTKPGIQHQIHSEFLDSTTLNAAVPSLLYDQNHHTNNHQQQQRQRQGQEQKPLQPHQRQNCHHNQSQQLLSLGQFESVTATLAPRLPGFLVILSVLLAARWLVYKLGSRRVSLSVSSSPTTSSSSSSIYSPSSASFPTSPYSPLPSPPSSPSPSLLPPPFLSPSITTYTTQPHSLFTRYLSQPNYQSLDYRILSPKLQTQQLINHQRLQHYFINAPLVRNHPHYFSVPPPPLTPPEVSESIFTPETCTSQTEFIHQPNPDYLSDTDAEEFINNAKMSNPQGSVVQPSTDGNALIIDPTAYDSPMHTHGEVIQGQGPRGQQWSRHTVVYNNGPCSCCISMNGGSYGPDVPPAEKHE